jgi:excisionase family DNA binding protein
MSASPVSRDLTIAEAAEDTNTDPKFIRRRISDGTLKAYRLKGSRLIRIRRADLEALKQPIGGAA